MGRKLADLDAGFPADAGDLVAIILALGRALEVEPARIPTGHLNALVSQARRPLRHRREAVERRFVARELREKNGRTLHRALSSRSTQAASLALLSCAAWMKRIPAMPSARLA